MIRCTRSATIWSCRVEEGKYEPTFRFVLPGDGAGARAREVPVDATPDDGRLTAKLEDVAASGIYEVQLQPLQGESETSRLRGQRARRRRRSGPRASRRADAAAGRRRLPTARRGRHGARRAAAGRLPDERRAAGGARSSCCSPSNCWRTWRVTTFAPLRGAERDESRQHANALLRQFHLQFAICSLQFCPHVAQAPPTANQPTHCPAGDGLRALAAARVRRRATADRADRGWRRSRWWPSCGTCIAATRSSCRGRSRIGVVAAAVRRAGRPVRVLSGHRAAHDDARSFTIRRWPCWST